MKVKFQQKTGSHSYIAHCVALVISCYFTLFTVPYYQIYIDLFEMQRKARKDQKVPEPNAVEISNDCHSSKTKGMKARKDQKVPKPNDVEIFKECHTSKKKGMTTQVNATVVSP